MQKISQLISFLSQKRKKTSYASTSNSEFFKNLLIGMFAKVKKKKELHFCRE